MTLLSVPVTGAIQLLPVSWKKDGPISEQNGAHVNSLDERKRYSHPRDIRGQRASGETMPKVGVSASLLLNLRGARSEMQLERWRAQPTCPRAH